MRYPGITVDVAAAVD